MSLKKTISVICITMISSVLMAQTGIGTTAPDTSSVLDITSTNKGFLPPRVASVNDISNPVKGLVVYDEYNNGIRFYNGTDWSDCIDGSYTAKCVVKVDATTYKDFLCHNLGADESLDSHTPDVGLQGGYVQWGKKGPADWVASENNGALGFVAAPTDGDANAGYILDWSQTSAQIDGSWNLFEANPVKVGANDPCPDGFRVPTKTEWTGVITNNTPSRTGLPWSPGDTKYGSALHYGPDNNTKTLTLPAAGLREFPNGSLVNRGYSGYYWSSTETGGSNALLLSFSPSFILPDNSYLRTIGCSVRCIAE